MKMDFIPALVSRSVRGARRQLAHQSKVDTLLADFVTSGLSYASRYVESRVSEALVKVTSSLCQKTTVLCK